MREGRLVSWAKSADAQRADAKSADAAMGSARFWAFACAAFVLDAQTKSWALRELSAGRPWPSADAPARLRLVFNTNLNLGLALPGGGPFVYTLLGLAVTGALLWTAARLSTRDQPSLAAFGLVVGGGLGNVLERARFGRVTDFLDLHVGVFNVSDVAITLGLCLYLLAHVRDGVHGDVQKDVWEGVRDGLREGGWKLGALAVLMPVGWLFL
jgi:signal peptidase II